MDELEQEARQIEYYGDPEPRIPSEQEFVGQDLIAQCKDEGYDGGGSADCGYSSDTVLCLMDPREFSNDCAYFTRQIRRLNGDLPRSRAVDTAIRRSNKDKKGGIETSLIQFSIAVWQVRVGETSCSCVSDISKNVNVSKNVTVKNVTAPTSDRAVRPALRDRVRATCLPAFRGLKGDV